jgi:ribosomal protein L22
MENKVLSKQKNVDVKTEIPENKKEETKNKVETVKTEEKKEKKQIQKTKKEEAVANGISFPISTKDSVAICKFIRGKKLDKAIEDLEEVLKFKKVIPMNAGYPHRKGKGVMAGRYHTKPVGFFVRLLKDLKANANMNGIDEPIIVEAIPNRAARPYGRFGRIQRKRTHLFVKVIENSKLKEIKMKKQKKKNKSGDKK